MGWARENGVLVARFGYGLKSGHWKVDASIHRLRGVLRLGMKSLACPQGGKQQRTTPTVTTLILQMLLSRMRYLLATCWKGGVLHSLYVCFFFRVHNICHLVSLYVATFSV